IETAISGSSWIRKMFEAGDSLKAIHGADNVYDFSLGNPNVEPPESFAAILKETVAAAGRRDHGYPPNAGYLDVRESIAAHVSTEQQSGLSGQEIIMTCGAAGALNVILKAILDPEDEVITPAPYFVEYNAYAANHGGVLRSVSTHPDFSLNIDAISAAITGKTKAVLINSPNNPTGQVYTAESLAKLGALLDERSKALNRTIYLISDEPYRKIVYDGTRVPSLFTCYRESLVATSYSKDLSIPGERIGFLAVNPAATYREDLLNAMTLANRILGYVNAPALMQRVVGALQGQQVDISEYARKRELICKGLAACGYEFTRPAGAFYLFPRTPIPDDVEFVRLLQEKLILVVPGSGFGGPGHFRIAFCVDDNTIKNAMPGFRDVMAPFK
ncbi:MAG: pyridoxal phosphate-dependent aminotransferase, partial [Desulfobacterales bacterium]